VVTGSDLIRTTSRGLTLDARTSSVIFNRTGLVRRIDVYLGLE
jgi:hypothetical protein